MYRLWISPERSSTYQIAAVWSVLKRAWPQRCQNGWRFAAVNWAFASAVVFLLNLLVTILWKLRKSDVLFRGNCDQAEQINSGLHILINGFSTILLSASNYCMQCLSAPTRKEVDREHARGRSLDVGILSIRNLRHISKRRVIAWLILGLSSVPLHLFYNSAVFLSLAVHDYEVYAVPQSFVDTPDCFNCTDLPEQVRDGSVKAIHQKMREGKLERLDNIDCINAYGTLLQTKRRDVLLVSEEVPLPPDVPPLGAVYSNSTSPAFWYWWNRSNNFALADYGNLRAADNYKWVCSSLPNQDTPCTVNIEQIRASPSNWTVGASCISPSTMGSPIGYCGRKVGMRPISYCLSEKIDQQCKIRFSIPIAVLVTTLNLLKIVIMLYTALGITEEPLMTMGDAVASFLEDKDPTIFSLSHIHGNANRAQGRDLNVCHRWRHATSKSRRTITFTFLAIAVATVIGLLIWCLIKLENGLGRSLTALASLGFGDLDPRAIIHYSVRTIIGNTLIANTAQVVASSVYLTYNSLFTCMLLNYEWISYTYQQKGLRVSREPQGAQRSSYFLSLPYRFSLPLMMTSGLLHWLISQSIFFVALEFHIPEWYLSRTEAYTCGYSPVAIICVIIVGILMLLAGVGAGFIPYRAGAPLMGSCSAIISAACCVSSGEGGGDAEMGFKRLRLERQGARADGAARFRFTSSEAGDTTDELEKA